MSRRMLVVSAVLLTALAVPTPASADHNREGCPHPFMLDAVGHNDPAVDRNGDGVTCVFFTQGGTLGVDNVLVNVAS